MFTNFVTFTSEEPASPIHLADADLQPICSQTAADRSRTLQQVMVGPATCRRCLRMAAIVAQQNQPLPSPANP